MKEVYHHLPPRHAPTQPAETSFGKPEWMEMAALLEDFSEAVGNWERRARCRLGPETSG